MQNHYPLQERQIAGAPQTSVTRWGLISEAIQLHKNQITTIFCDQDLAFFCI
jgi:hypothetical protein